MTVEWDKHNPTQSSTLTYIIAYCTDAMRSAIGLSSPRVVVGQTLEYAFNKGNVTIA